MEYDIYIVQTVIFTLQDGRSESPIYYQISNYVHLQTALV